MVNNNEDLLSNKKRILLNLLKPTRLFNWNDVPGNDNGRLIEYLEQKYGVDWVRTAKIDKTIDGKNINISNEKNFLSLELNNDKIDVNIKVDDVRTDKFMAIIQNHNSIVYEGCISTGEMADKLGHKKDGKVGYNAINNELVQLKKDGMIDSRKIKTKPGPGPTPTLHEIIYEISVFKKIVKDYRELIPYLQKNDKVITMVLNSNSKRTYDESDPYDKTVGDYLRLSISFFENYLMHDSFFDDFKETWINVSVHRPVGVNSSF